MRGIALSELEGRKGGHKTLVEVPIGVPTLERGAKSIFEASAGLTHSCEQPQSIVCPHFGTRSQHAWIGGNLD